MATQKKSATDTIVTVSGRKDLLPRHAPYFQKLRHQCHLGFRKTTADSHGAWIARYGDASGKYEFHSLGSLESVIANRRYDEAAKLATEWFDYRSGGGSSESITVKQTCERFLEHLKASNKPDGAKDNLGRFERWVYSDVTFSSTPLIKLTSAMVDTWRKKMIATPVILQDKSKKGTKKRAGSTINRDLAPLRAALNLALEDNLVTSDVAWKTKLKPIKDADSRRDCYLDITQRRALVDNSPPDLAALIKALSLVPLRPGAMAALTVGSFSASLSVLSIGKDKAGRDRKITLPKSTAQFLTDQSKGKASTAPLIAQSNGNFWNKDAWKVPFKETATKLGLSSDAVMYALRHSAITDLIVYEHLDIMTVARLSGTSLAMIEKNYGHLLQSHAAKGLAGLAL